MEELDDLEAGESYISSENIPEPDIKETPPDLLWIREGADFITTTVYIYKDPSSNRLRSILIEPSPGLREAGMIEFPVETRWSIPTKEQLSEYRERSSRYNSGARAVLVQRGLLEDYILRNHLVEMVFGTEGSQSSLELIRDKKGRLSNESMVKINQLHPSVMDLIFAKFIDESALLL